LYCDKRSVILAVIFTEIKLKMSNEKEAKLKALKLTLDKLDKAYGKGTVMRMSDSPIQDVEAIPSGSLGLDIALGVGGYPRGRVIEIYGPESSGKTTLTLHAIAEAQKAGGIAAFIDAEHAFDRFYAQKLGIDVDNLIMSQPDNGEQALEIADNLIRSGAIDIVVIDSVAALTPKSEIEGVIEIVNAYDSILIIYEPLVITYSGLIKRLDEVCRTMDKVELPKTEIIHIPVLYGGMYGEDIEYVADYNNLTIEEVIDIHCRKDYLVYMIGFTPGFPYLGGVSEKISVPRLEVPRERVPGGSVGIAGTQTGIYPVESPGGWRIIGRTPLVMFDPKRDPIFLLNSGNYIRFEPINEETYSNIRP